jgi:hypothetical protein
VRAALRAGPVLLGLALLAACAGTAEPGWPEAAGGPPPAGAYTEVLATADLSAAGEDFHPVVAAASAGVVYVYGQFPFDSDSEDPPPPPDVLLAFPVVDGGLGEPAVFTERTDFPATSRAYDVGLTTAADGDALLLVELADDDDVEHPGTGDVALIRLDPATGAVNTFPVAEDPVDQPREGLSTVSLSCSADDVCAALVSDGFFHTLLLRLDARTGAVLGSTTVRDGDEILLDGLTSTPDGSVIALLGEDVTFQEPREPGYPDERVDVPWVQFFGADLVPLGGPVPITDDDERLGGVAQRADGSVVAAVSQDDGAVSLVVVGPEGPRADVTAPLEGLGELGALDISADGGWLYAVGSDADDAPTLVSVDLASGAVTEATICSPGTGLTALWLTSAGAVGLGSCGPGNRLVLLGPAG